MQTNEIICKILPYPTNFLHNTSSVVYAIPPQDLAVTTLYYIYLCSTKPWIRYLSLGLLYGYKCVLQICALYFAFQTRKVKVKGLNDAKYIAVMVYVVTIVLVITLASTFALTNYVNVYAVIYCVGLAISGSVILGLTFIPKVPFSSQFNHHNNYVMLLQQMMMLYNDPNGEKVFSENEYNAKHVSTVLPCAPPEESEVDKLRAKVKQLETEIDEYKVGVT